MQQVFEAPEFLFDGPTDAPVMVALAHGAGAPMDSPFMAFFADGLAARGWRVARFEFPYMAARRRGGKPRPPDRTDILLATWQAAIAALGAERLVVGGKSLGGRMASMVADGAGVLGLICLGYPFHPPARPEQPRIAHLRALATPTLIVQGARDPFGTPEELARWPLSPAIRVHLLDDGDHGFVPRVASGRTKPQNLEEALAACHAFLLERAAGPSDDGRPHS